MSLFQSTYNALTEAKVSKIRTANIEKLCKDFYFELTKLCKGSGIDKMDVAKLLDAAGAVHRQSVDLKEKSQK